MRPLDAEHRLIVALCQWRPPAAVLDAEADTARAAELVDRYRCAELIHCNAVRANLAPPAGSGMAALLAHCEHAFRATEERAAAYTHALHEAASALASAGIPVIVLKGMALARFVYETPAYKRMNDVDIMVPRHAYRAAIDLLLARGFTPESGDTLLHRKELLHHYVPLLGPGGVPVDLHWSITGAHGFAVDLDDLWKRAVPLPGEGGPDLLRLGDMDFLHHLLVHFHYYRSKITDVFDVANLYRYVRERGVTDAGLRAVADASRAADAHFRTLRFAAMFADDEELRRLAARLRPDRAFWRREAENRARDPQFVLEGRTNYFGRLEHSFKEIGQAPAGRLPAAAAFARMLLYPEVEHLRSLENDRALAGGARARIRNARRIWHYYRHVV